MTDQWWMLSCCFVWSWDCSHSVVTLEVLQMGTRKKIIAFNYWVRVVRCISCILGELDGRFYYSYVVLLSYGSSTSELTLLFPKVDVSCQAALSMIP